MQRHDFAGPVALRAMQELAVRVFPRAGYRHVGDLAWGWCLALGREAECPTAVWTHEGRAVAWGWLELPDALMLQVDPAHPELADEVLDWAEQRAAGRLRVEVAGTESEVVAALERRGCPVDDDGSFLLVMGRSLTHPPDPPPLPGGYAIRAEPAGRVAVHGAAFGSTRLTAEGYARLRRTWPYRPEFDLTVVSPAGEAVAYCQGWYDEVNGVGAFEPVGTHPGHRRLGLGRAVCAAVLRAFADAGGRRAVVCCRGDAAYPVPRLLYASLGFTPQTRTRTYLAARSRNSRGA